MIDAVGAGVDAARVGERVWVYFAAWQRQWGTAAQFCVVPSEQAVPLPAERVVRARRVAGDPGADRLPLPARGRAGRRCRRARRRRRGRGRARGDRAARCGRARGSIATVSGAEKGVLARAAGADVVVNYRADDAAEQIRAAAPDGVSTDRRARAGAEPRARSGGDRRRTAVIATYAADQATAEVPIRRADVAEPDAALRARLQDRARRAARGGGRCLPGGRGRGADHVADASVRARGHRGCARRGRSAAPSARS